MIKDMLRPDGITVASYYFGNYHPGDARNTREKGAGWSEWELVKAARPRFPGHAQPKAPLWGYPFMNTLGNNTLENFRRALDITRQRLLARPAASRIFNINCWNEWTEGSYLESDTVHGLKYLEAIAAVFPPAGSVGCP